MEKRKVNLRRKHKAQDEIMEGIMKQIVLIEENCKDGIAAEEGEGDGYETLGIMREEAVKVAKRMGYDRYNGLF